MILVDTSIWIDHLRSSDPELVRRLNVFEVATHPFVIGEIALGSLQRREEILSMLLDLPKALMAEDDEVLAFVRRYALFGRGIGYVDAHLLAATRLSPGMRLWTRDRRLDMAAQELGLAA